MAAKSTSASDVIPFRAYCVMFAFNQRILGSLCTFHWHWKYTVWDWTGSKGKGKGLARPVASCFQCSKIQLLYSRLFAQYSIVICV